jgi:ferredoxin-NADP reductase
MLTEPQTMPSSKTDRRIFAVLVGLLFSLSFQFGTLSATPEFALIIGNIYAFVMGMRKRVELAFHGSTQLSREVYEFAFVPSTPFVFQPGQYIEWTLPHSSPDKRGIRRYFTLASASGDPFVRLGVRIPKESSTFKDALQVLKKGNVISAANLSGDFVLPSDPNQPIAAIAGGVGITPFMSMFRQLAAEHMCRDIVLIYAASTPLDFAYKNEIDSIKDSIGLNVIYLPTDFTELVNWEGLSGYLTEDLIKKHIPNFKTRHWYLSGPSRMLLDYKHLIRSIGVSRSFIKTDYFPGF